VKTLKKLAIVSIAVVIILACAALGYAQFWLTSNVEHVKIDYTITLSKTISQDKVMLTAHVSHDGAPLATKGIAFYYTKSYATSIQTVSGSASTNWTWFDTQPTDVLGNAHANYTITDVGDYYFLTQTTVP
jgi:hypothetical protein